MAGSKRRCLLVDLDGQRTLSFGLGLDGSSPTAMDWLQGSEVIPLATPVKHLSLIPGSLALFQLQADSDLFSPALARLTDIR